MMSQESYAGQEEGQEAETVSDSRYLTFLSDNLIFAVNTENVIEIITNYTVRPIPLVPDYIRGIINVRGQIIPIIDMRLRLGKPADHPDTSCIIILEVDSNTIGIVVDSVSQVLNLEVENASPLPIENQNELATSILSLPNGRVVLLLNLEAILQG